MKKLSYEKWCLAFIQNLASHFNLSGWVISTEISKENKTESENCYASMSTDSTYFKAWLKLYPPLKEDFDKGDITHFSEVLIHEFCHVLVNPLHEQMSPFLSDASRPAFNRDLENVTQRLAMVMLKTFPKNLIPPR